MKRVPKKKSSSLKVVKSCVPLPSSPTPPSSQPAPMLNDNPAEMSTLLIEEPAPLELTTQGINSRTSPGPIHGEPSASPLDESGPAIVDDQQDFYVAQQQAPLPQQRLFDLNQLTEEEKIVLSSSGTARLYQANSQDEIDAIMQQVLDSKTTDTILIVSPIGRQIVTRNEDGDQIITRVMTASAAVLADDDNGQHRSESVGADFHAESPENLRIPEPVLNFSGTHNQSPVVERHPGVYEHGSDMIGSPAQSVIYEKHLTAEQIEMLNDQELRKTGRDIQDLYAEQSTATGDGQSGLVYDTNNNPNNGNLHRQQLEEQMMKGGVVVGGGSDHDSGNSGEVMGAMINGDDKSQIDLIYNDGCKTVIYTAAPTAVGAATTSSAAEGQKSMGMYATSATDLETFMGNGGAHQMVVQENGLPFGAAQSASTVFVVQEMVNDEAMDLQSGLRRRTSSHPDSPMSGSDQNGTEVISQVSQASSQAGYLQTRYFEHPLSAATTAMLTANGGGGGHNPSGNPNEDESPEHGGALNINNLVTPHQVHQVNNPNGSTTFLYEYYKVPDKESGAIQWSNPTTAAVTTTTTAIAKLNGGQTTPLDVSSLSQCEIQGLFGAHPAATSPGSVVPASSPPLDHQQQHHHHHHLTTNVVLLSQGSGSNLSIKREPEDLRKDPSKCLSRTQKVLLQPSTSPSSELPIKEQPPSPGSPPTENMYAAAAGSTQIYLQGPTHQSSNLSANTPSPGPYVSDQYGMYAARLSTPGVSTFVTEPYYREYFSDGQNYVQATRSLYSGGVPSSESGDNNGSPVMAHPGMATYESRLAPIQSASDAYAAHHNNNNTTSVNKNTPIYAKAVTAAGLTVDLPSPDSGIGADAITPRDQNNIQQSFDYTELCQSSGMLEANGSIPVSVTNIQRSVVHGVPGSPNSSLNASSLNSTLNSSRSRPWHDFGRQSEADKVQIPKIFSNVGFKYHLESPISSSQRREDDRITYINKGQFYGISLEYVHDSEKPLKNQTVKSVIMLMFREEKSPDDEIKAWQFWHSRQHSVKQRILDADTKNSAGIVGCIEEVAHNAIAVYWNPLESSAKINIAVQCLSTDFSSQKGVKGLPLHLQIDTFEDPRDTQLFHRGYCQIKVFCDKGAERKTRDEERRAAKRKMTATGRKKIDELYHPVTERSEFYAMQDVAKPPVLFTPSEDMESKLGMDLQSFYGHDGESFGSGGGGGGGGGGPADIKPFLLNASTKPATPTLKFHNHFPPDVTTEKKEHGMEPMGLEFGASIKRQRMSPMCDRVMLYVRQENEDIYTPLHVVPPTTTGLLNAIENRYKISSSSIINLYRKNRKGIIAKIDDEMLSYYCNEDIFLLEVRQVEEDLYNITLTELMG